MDYETFSKIAEAASQELKHSPSAYKRKLLLFSSLGYVAVFSLLAVVILLIGGTVLFAVTSPAIFLMLVKKKLIFVLLFALWVLIKSLWVRFDSPQGYRLTKKQAPEFFVMLNRLRANLKAPKIHQVIVTPELNAAIVQSPRLGIFGWQSNTLIIGLELMLILDEQEMESVIAHELGHLSGSHSQFNGRIYRARTTWNKIMHALEDQDSWANFLTRSFFSWYAPRFAAYSFALARHNEYEADAVAALLTSKKATGSALVHTYAIGPLIDKEYWAAYYRQARDYAEPPYLPFTGLSRFLSEQELSQQSIAEELKREMAVKTDVDNTHPALNDRLGALSVSPQVRSSNIVSAATVLLGEFKETLISDFDENWYAENKDKWADYFEETQAEKNQLATLETKDIHELDQDGSWALAAFTEKYKGDKQDPLPLYRYYMHRYPEDKSGQFHAGRLLLARNNEAGLSLLKQATSQPYFVDDACHMAYCYLMDNNRSDEAEQWREVAIKQYEIDQEAQQERNEITIEDTLEIPQVGDDLIQNLALQILTENKVKEVWLAQKRVKHYPDSPVLIFAVKFGGFGDKDEKLQNLLKQMEFPYDVFGINQSNGLFKKVKQVGFQLQIKK